MYLIWRMRFCRLRHREYLRKAMTMVTLMMRKPIKPHTMPGIDNTKGPKTIKVNWEWTVQLHVRRTLSLPRMTLTGKVDVWLGRWCDRFDVHLIASMWWSSGSLSEWGRYRKRFPAESVGSFFAFSVFVVPAKKMLPNNETVKSISTYKCGISVPPKKGAHSGPGLMIGLYNSATINCWWHAIANELVIGLFFRVLHRRHPIEVFRHPECVRSVRYSIVTSHCPERVLGERRYLGYMVLYSQLVHYLAELVMVVIK